MRHLWKETGPFIATMKPADDLCHSHNSEHLSGDEKALRLTHYTNHLNLAKQVRSDYNQQAIFCTLKPTFSPVQLHILCLLKPC